MCSVRRSCGFYKQHNKISAVFNRKKHLSNIERSYGENLNIAANNEFPYNTISMPKATGTKEELEEFQSVLPETIRSFVSVCAKVPELGEHYTELLYEHVGKDKQASGFLVNTVYKFLANPRQLTNENIKLANILGCCCDVLFAMDTIVDDIVESSKLRFGKPCWYKREDVGLEAINDAVFMENSLYLVLKKYFSELRSYVPILESFHDASVKSTIGQRLDGVFTGSGKPRLELFTMENYKTLIRFKVIPFAYWLPIISGMYLAEKFDPKLHRHVNDVIWELGLSIGVQNDILDCYGNPLLTGKTDTDIARGNCTWLAVTALEQGTPAQKEILWENYGKNSNKSVLKVRNVYDELRLMDQYLKWEKESFKTACQAVQEISSHKYQQGFYKIIETAYGQKCSLELNYQVNCNN